MAQGEQYKGILGYETRSQGTLDRASSILIGALEEYGHSVSQFEARAASQVVLHCDQYRVELRLRRLPVKSRERHAAGVPPCAARLEVAMHPAFPDHCDREITQMLLAIALHRLVEGTGAVTVRWLGSAAVLTRNEFLGVFTAAAAPVLAAATPAPQARPRGRDCFAPVDETAAELEQHCEEILRGARDRASGRFAKQAKAQARARVRAAVRRGRPPLPQRLAAWTITGVLATVSLPLAGTAAAVNLLRGGDLRFSVQVLTAAALFLFLENAGMVQAAITYLP